MNQYYTQEKILAYNINYLFLNVFFKMYKNYLFYEKVIHIFNNLKILKKHMNKNRSRKRNRKKRR